MKKAFVVFGLILLMVLVGSCAPGKTIAGQAVSTSSTYLTKGDYFALSDAVGKIHLYQYKGADAPTKKDNPKIRLKDIETGYTLELDYFYQGYAGGLQYALLKVGLYQSYAGGTDESKDYYLILGRPSSMDSPIFVSFDTEGKEKLPLAAVTLKI